MSVGTVPLHVAVAAIFDRQGRVLLARRPEHVHQGGLWEFPGGKLEPGEDVRHALARELWEELYIRPAAARPLIRIPYRYPDRCVLLDVWRVDGYSGRLCGREGQPLAWVQPSELARYPLPAANRPIANAVRLPPLYAISAAAQDGVEAFLSSLQRSLARGIRLIQLRPLLALDDPGFERLVMASVALAHAAGAKVLLNAAPDTARRLGADGVHLNSRRLLALRARPLGREYLVAASCHDPAQLEQAAAIDADFAVYSPVAATASHPQARPLGWPGFARAVADAPLPVYALGGVGPDDLDRAQRARAQGVAGIGAFWG